MTSYRVFIAVLCSAFGLMGCGSGSQSTRTTELTKLEAQEITPLSGGWWHSFRIDDSSFLGLNNKGLIRYNANGDTVWNTRFILDSIEIFDHGGAHIENNNFYLASTRQLQGGFGEYTVRSFDLRSGALNASVPLSKVNPGDRSGPIEDLLYEASRPKRPYRSMSAVFSPDSSKLLAYKFYPIGNDKLGVEMMMYKRGYVLASRNNVDFRFDHAKQQFLGVLTDNDGVAYLLLASKEKPVLEVGRFEVLGGKRIRTLRHELAPNHTIGDRQTAISVASRGHLYVGMVSNRRETNSFELIDFDFYLDSAIVSVIDSSIPKGVASLKDLFVSPMDDRIVAAVERENDDQLHVNTYGMDLNCTPLWRSNLTIEEPSHFKGMLRTISRELAYWYWNGTTLNFKLQSLRTGEWLTDSKSEKLVTGDKYGISNVWMLNRRTLITDSPAYKIVLPK